MSESPAPSRFERAEALREEAHQLRAWVGQDLAALRPMGMASELSVAMGLRPRRGVAMSVPSGHVYVFAKSRQPSEADLRIWQARYEQAKALDEQALDLTSFGIVDANCTFGNAYFASKGRALADAGLLTADEVAFVERLEAYWATHDDDDWGVVAPDGSLHSHKEES
jgi:hypothetical protein